MKVYLSADHGGLELKNHIKERLTANGYDVEDFGTNSSESVDYPVYGKKVAKAVVANTGSFGIVVCGSGIGISIAANRVHGARAALIRSVEEAKLTREHNDANILALGGRFTSQAEADGIVDTFLSTEFEGGRHQKRVLGIDE